MVQKSILDCANCKRKKRLDYELPEDHVFRGDMIEAEGWFTTIMRGSEVLLEFCCVECRRIYIVKKEQV